MSLPITTSKPIDNPDKAPVTPSLNAVFFESFVSTIFVRCTLLSKPDQSNQDFMEVANNTINGIAISIESIF